MNRSEPLNRKDNFLVLGGLLKRLDVIFTTQSNNYLKKFGVTWAQAQILKFLAVHFDNSVNQDKTIEVFQKDIETYFNLSNPTVTGIVKRLEEKNLIQREAHAKDRRWRKLQITEAGYKLQDEIYLDFVAADGILTDVFSDDELHGFTLTLVEVLEKLDPGVIEKSNSHQNVL